MSFHKCVTLNELRAARPVASMVEERDGVSVFAHLYLHGQPTALYEYLRMDGRVCLVNGEPQYPTNDYVMNLYALGQLKYQLERKRVETLGLIEDMCEEVKSFL